MQADREEVGQHSARPKYQMAYSAVAHMLSN